MRAPSRKSPTPRIRTLGPEPPCARPAARPPAPSVFRDFVSTLERLERACVRPRARRTGKER